MHGGTYTGIYWNFQYEPETYSYVHAMNEAGLATLTIDRLGSGGSSHPPSSQVTMPSNIEAVHQVVQALRNGDFGQQFSKVVLVGHSLGTLISIGVVTQYPDDADGLLATGVSHGVGLSGLSDLLLGVANPYSANNEEQFSHLDDGYITTRPGERDFFYHTPTADPDVIAADEATKDTVTLVEFVTGTPSLISTLAVRVPVLAVVGEHDSLFCDPLPCSSPLNLWTLEQTFYLNAPSFQRFTVPGSGHSFVLHPNAPVFYDKAVSWVTTVVGLS